MAAVTTTATQSATTPNHLLRFLLPVLLLHVLVFATLPYWPSNQPAGPQGIAVELAPIATLPVQADKRESSADTPVAKAPPQETTPAAAKTTPQSALATTPPRPPITTPDKAITAETTVDQRTPAATPEAAPVPADARATPASPPPVETVATSGDIASQASAAPAAGAWQDDYRSALRNALARHHHYPARARRFGMSGTATVRFAILRDGHFENIMLARSSGADLLDQAALVTVQRLGRFQPLPGDYSEDSWTVSVPLVYRRD